MLKEPQKGEIKAGWNLLGRAGDEGERVGERDPLGGLELASFASEFGTDTTTL